MIKNNVDDVPVATAHIPIPLPPSALPTPSDLVPMNADSEFLNWINPAAESELTSPDFGHTPLHSFEDEGVDDSPLNDLVTPQFADLDIFTEPATSNNGRSEELNLEGLFTMDSTPEALMTYFDYSTFGDVSGTGVDSSMFGMTTENESIPLMGPPTNVSFANIWDDVPKKKRKVHVEEEPEGQRHQEAEETTMRPADMHVSQSATTMAPPEVPLNLISRQSGPSSTSPKPRSPLTRVPPLNIINTTPITAASRQTSNRKYTGTRAGLTTEKLIPLDAPIQSRNYVLPSSTSRKEVPAAFADKIAQAQLGNRGKKRARSEIDESTPVPSNDDDNTVAESSHLHAAIEAKRLQNTYAARRSRARKLEYLKGLEDEIKTLREENEFLRNRVEVLEDVVRNGGGPEPEPT